MIDRNKPNYRTLNSYLSDHDSRQIKLNWTYEVTKVLKLVIECYLVKS